MASSTPTTCPKCGGRASFHSDDGITYCEETDCRAFDVEENNRDYQPPDNRGGS